MSVDKRKPGSMIPVVMADPAPGMFTAIAAVVLVAVSVLATVTVMRTPPIPKDDSSFCEAALKDVTVIEAKMTRWFHFSSGDASATTTVDKETKELVQTYSVTCEMRTPLTFKKG